MRISYVVPAHNEARVLEGTVQRVVDRLSANHSGSQVIVVENGSTDATAAVAQRLAADLTDKSVEVIAARSGKGFGNAYREGLRHATGEVVVFTAADLPFGFSDLEAYLAREPRPPVAIGSKAHPESNIEIGALRRFMSWAFSVLRRIVLQMKVKDSQGTILMEGDLARELLPDLISSDYLVSTEMIARASAQGVEAIELPIEYVDLRKDSKVEPLRDGWRMFRGLLRLRKSLKRAG